MSSTTRRYPDNGEGPNAGKGDRECKEEYLATWRRNPQTFPGKYDVNQILNKLYKTSTLFNAKTKFCFRCGWGDHQLMMTNVIYDE